MRRQERRRILVDRLCQYNHSRRDCEDVTVWLQYTKLLYRLIVTLITKLIFTLIAKLIILLISTLKHRVFPALKRTTQ
jgi:hypothetical protein